MPLLTRTFRATSEPCAWMTQKCTPLLPTAASWPAAKGLKATSCTQPDTATLDSSWKVSQLHRATCGSEKSPTRGKKNVEKRQKVAWCLIYQLRSLTNRQEEATIPGEGQTLHCPLMVSDGTAAFSVLKVPYADEAPAAMATPRCRHNCLDKWRSTN